MPSSHRSSRHPAPEARPSPGQWEILKPLARQMRHEPTEAEVVLWEALRAGRLEGRRFRRQHAIDRFIVDFYCPAALLVIELDGPIHAQTHEQDVLRQTILESLGVRVLRFTNDEVLERLDGVLERIDEAVEEPHPPASPLHEKDHGEGEKWLSAIPLFVKGQRRGSSEPSSFPSHGYMER